MGTSRKVKCPKGSVCQFKTHTTNMGNTQDKMQYTEVDMPLYADGTEVFEFPLQTFARKVKGVGSLQPLPRKVVLKIYPDRAELWAKDGESVQPIEHWAFCNITSWGCNTVGLRIKLLSEQLVGEKRQTRLQQTLEFKTKQGAEIVAIFKRITCAMASDLKKARRIKSADAVRPQTAIIESPAYSCSDPALKGAESALTETPERTPPHAPTTKTEYTGPFSLPAYESKVGQGKTGHEHDTALIATPVNDWQASAYLINQHSCMSPAA